LESEIEFANAGKFCLGDPTAALTWS